MHTRSISLTVIRQTNRLDDPTTTPEPVSCGVPLPQGFLADAYGCSLVDASGRLVASQHTAMSHWPDGSIRWLFVEFTVPSGITPPAAYVLDFARTRTQSDVLLANGASGGIEIGGAGFTATFRSGTVIELGRAGLRAGSLAIQIVDADGRAQDVALTDLSVEWNGSQRATVLAQGRAPIGSAQVNVSLRLTAFATDSLMRLDLTIHNPRRAEHPGNFWELGDAGSILFKGLRAVLTPTTPVDGCFLTEDIQGAWEAAECPLVIYQESSGGEQWNSRVHVDRNGQVPMRMRGFRLASGSRRREGRRAQPAVQVASGQTSWTASLLNFWEEFPSALEVADSGAITIAPFPEQFPDLYELQGGERKTRTLFLASGEIASSRRAVTQALRPSVARCDAAHLRESGALSFFADVADARHQMLIQNGLDGDRSFLWKRERQDEYGWRNFGDIYADHETVFVGEAPTRLALQQSVRRRCRLRAPVPPDGRCPMVAPDGRSGASRLRHRHLSHRPKISRPTTADCSGIPTTTWTPARQRIAHIRASPVYRVAARPPSRTTTTGLALHYCLTGWIPSREPPFRSASGSLTWMTAARPCSAG